MHDCNGSISLRGNAIDRTNQVDVYGNTVSNIGGNQSEQGQHWAGIEVNHADVANVYMNDIDDVAEGQWGEGQAFQFWDIGTLNMYNNNVTNCYEGIYVFAGDGSPPYGGPYAIPGGYVSYNDISGNSQYGSYTRAPDGEKQNQANYDQSERYGAVEIVAQQPVQRHVDRWLTGQVKCGAFRQEIQARCAQAIDEPDLDVQATGCGGSRQHDVR